MQNSAINSIRVDRTAFSVTSLHDPPDELSFWLSKTPEARWQAMSLIRLINYGDAATGRLQRVFEVAQLERR